MTFRFSSLKTHKCSDRASSRDGSNADFRVFAGQNADSSVSAVLARWVNRPLLGLEGCGA